jgi:hypothetical protein
MLERQGQVRLTWYLSSEPVEFSSINDTTTKEALWFNKRPRPRAKIYCQIAARNLDWCKISQSPDLAVTSPNPIYIQIKWAPSTY